MSVKLLLIGAGAWGQKYISTLAAFPDASLTVANRNNWKELVDQHPDGVMVCTPPQSHVEIASYSLARQIPTMIEKPLALSLEEAIILQQYSAPILVNHVQLFSQRYQSIKQELLSDDIIFIASSGCGNSMPRNYSELWDYGPHDIAMILDLAQQMPIKIECEEKFTRCFLINLQFEKFKTCSFVGYTEGDKERWLLTSNGSRIFECFECDGKATFPLTNALKVFIGAIHGQPDYRLGLDLSLNVLKVLEKCQESLHFDAFMSGDHK